MKKYCLFSSYLTIFIKFHTFNKAELNVLRTELTNYKAQVAELEAALSKVELADRLGCTANDLKSHKINCPVDKVGQVIGKGGSNIKKLETKTGCLIDLDKVKNEIHLQGNEDSIKKAILEIENITLAIEVEVKLSEAVCAFLMNKVWSDYHRRLLLYPLSLLNQYLFSIFNKCSK